MEKQYKKKTLQRHITEKHNRESPQRNTREKLEVLERSWNY